MRKLLKLAVVAVMAVPLATFAGPGSIAASKHNLSTSGTNLAAKATTQTEICVFCHTPHNAESTVLLWNRTSNSTAGWTSANTTAGTPLPTSAQVQLPTKNCLSCHDGTQGLGNVRNYQAATANFTMTGADVNATTGQLTNGTYLIGAGDNLNQNHPVSIPYPGATYVNGLVSAVTGTAATYYRSATTTGCIGSAVCTTGGTYSLRLYGTSATDAGMECGSCHEPHDNANGMFLRGSNDGSALCQSCHNK